MDDLTIRKGEIAGITLINEHLIKDDITQLLLQQGVRLIIFSYPW